MFDVVIKFENLSCDKLTAKMTIDSEVSSINVVRDMAVKKLYEVAAVRDILFVKISCFKYYSGEDTYSGIYYRGMEFIDDYEFVGDITISVEDGGGCK